MSLVQLQRALDITGIEMNAIIHNMEKQYRQEERGIQLYITDDTVQLVSNKKYASYVEELLQPAQTKSFTQAMLETLSIVAYKQPVTRADIEAVRGVRCDYHTGAGPQGFRGAAYDVWHYGRLFAAVWVTLHRGTA